jgi:acyl-CoA reductase-like NAD-dependent aldehyde dehydrogenase
MKPKDRQNILLSLSKFIEDNKVEILKLETTPFKPNPNIDIDMAIDICRFYAGVSRCLQSHPQDEYNNTCTSSVRYEPIGHCLGVIPWNYPLTIAMWKVAPALAAGCSIDIKLNNKNIGSVEFIFNNWKSKLNVSVVDNVDFNKYDFIDITGSKETATYFKNNHPNVIADVGGASIAIVEDGDIDFIVKNLEWSIKYNGGADCTSPKHIFCKTNMYTQIIKKLDCVVPNNIGDIDHFNPIATISSYSVIDELIDDINLLKNRLGLHLYTNNLTIQRLISKKAKWGNIFINKPLTTPIEMPHSGLGMSGNSFNQSTNKVYQYLVPKHIVVGDQSNSLI